MFCASKYFFCSIFLLLLSLKVTDLNAARILGYFPTPSISHQVVFRPLMKELLRKGHEITVITPDPAFSQEQTPENFTEIDIHDVSYKKLKEIQLDLVTSSSYIKRMTTLNEMFTNIFDVQMNDTNVQKVLHKDSNYYDLLLIEACVRPALVLSHFFKAPIILVSSLGAVPPNLEAMGIPSHPILYPTIIRKRIYNLSLWEKVKELSIELGVKVILSLSQNFENEVLRRNFGPDVPTVRELSNNVDMLFLNVHPIWAENIPVPPSVVFLGGLHINSNRKLPEDMNYFLSTSKNGVIYLSFGTNVKTCMIKPEIRQKLIEVLSVLPYDILWKWDTDELPGITENIKISKWLPQAELLRHPKVKLFITQGGLQSIDESIVAGVPLIGFPMLADQWYNVEKIVHFKIGLQLNIETFTESELRNAIFTVIEDKSYRENMVKFRSIIYDQPQSSLERAIWWTEYVLRRGGARHLRAPSANMHWAEYYELKLVVFILLAFVIIVLTIISIMKALYRIISLFRRSVKIKVS